MVLSFIICPIDASHNQAVKQIIQHGGREFGAIGDGFGPSDTEVEAMSLHYNQPQRGYWVALQNDIVVGCGGIAELDDASKTCELRKLFVNPQCRGQGLGKALAEHCLQEAKRRAYKQCYLDTLSSMHSAIALYQALGFYHLPEPFSASIHSGCDVWMMKAL
ncbi:GNAT family N-acetyltransferase [Agarivorans sp. Alg241-V36]|uniref:GNAT family N-acetyltransferase n=1 Tax=Agarivorans sp. Alg241-V36 TaxID=2305992 RepID=UPI0013D5556A|nr:GNAT family N-acetyltransferase [Agarivorans sp. Alg241-V36]